MTVKYGDTIGFVSKVRFDMKGNENYWKLSEGKVKSIIINSKGRRVKADHFYTLDAEEIEHNTKWMTENDRLILIGEPFILTDEIRVRMQKWIEYENANDTERFSEGSEVGCPIGKIF